MEKFLYLILAIANVVMFWEIDIKASLTFAFIAGLYFESMFSILKKD